MRLEVPSLVKWLSMWPLVCDIVVMMAFHDVFIAGLRYAFELSVRSYDEDGDAGNLSELSDPELLGIPVADTGAWHKQEHRRALKVFRWAETPGTFHNQVLYLHVAGPLMKLHYRRSFSKGRGKGPYAGRLPHPCVRFDF